MGNFRVQVGGTIVPYERFTYPGGEVQVRLSEEVVIGANVSIRADVRSSEDVMELLLLKDAVDRALDYPSVHLLLPYLPYARQDRVANYGESHALKVFCQLINAANFIAVETWDAHSIVAGALLDRHYDKPQWRFAQHVPVDRPCSLISPDAGALKKTLEVAKHRPDHPNGMFVIQAAKHRDPFTGEVSGTELQFQPDVLTAAIQGRQVLICDDICDGGRTFIELAKLIQIYDPKKISLYVTHGIFSQGLAVFDGLIDEFWTPNPWPSVVGDARLNVIDGETC